jgi:putative NADH-flavin reductase
LKEAFRRFERRPRAAGSARGACAPAVRSGLRNQEQTMDLAVFGATGRTGRLVLAEAARRGWPVRALVRDAARAPSREGLVVQQGDTRDAAAVRALLVGSGGQQGRAGAVICALGMSDITQPATDFSDSVKTILAAMRAAGVRRIVAIASAGVFEHPAGGYRNQQPDFPAYLKNISAEHVRNYETLRDSGLDWTLMCPMTLVDDVPAGSSKYALESLPAGSGETGYADLAGTMCDLLAERAAFGRRVGIVSYRKAT